MTESRKEADRQRRFALAYWAIAAGIIVGLNVDGSRFTLGVVVVAVTAGLYAVGEVVALLVRRHRSTHEPAPPGPVHISGFPLPAGRRAGPVGLTPWLRKKEGRERRFTDACASIIFGTFAATHVEGSLFDSLSFLVGVTVGLHATFRLLPTPDPGEGDAG